VISPFPRPVFVSLLLALVLPAVAAAQYQEVRLVGLAVVLKNGKVELYQQVLPARGPLPTAVFDGRDSRDEAVRVELPLDHLLALEVADDGEVGIESSQGWFPLRGLRVLFAEEGIKIFTRYADDRSCAAGTQGIPGAVIWVRDEDRRVLLPRALADVRHIEWSRFVFGPLKVLAGVPDDLPIGKGLSRIFLPGRRTEFQSFDPAIGENDLAAILKLLPSVSGGVEESFPPVFPPRAGDFPRLEDWLAAAAAGREMSAGTVARLRAHAVPSAFQPLKEALLEFFARKEKLDLAVEEYAVGGDLPALRRAVLGLFPSPALEAAFDRAAQEKTVVAVLDRLDQLLYPEIIQFFLNHGPPGLLAVRLLAENRLHLVEDPRLSPCSVPSGP
jgi:hypothetical protein